MKTKEELLNSLTTLTPLELRTLNRYYLHTEGKRCCNKCFEIFDNFKEHFHVKKHYKDGSTGYNVKCAKCFNAENQKRQKSYRKDANKFIKSRLSGIASRAKSISCPFNLTAEYLQELWVKQNGKCYYTDTAISFELIALSGKAPDHSTPSLDRLDPIKGYVVGNVVWCAYAINRMKNEFSLEEFLYMCDLITKTRGRTP